MGSYLQHLVLRLTGDAALLGLQALCQVAADLSEVLRVAGRHCHRVCREQQSAAWEVGGHRHRVGTG